MRVSSFGPLEVPLSSLAKLSLSLLAVLLVASGCRDTGSSSSPGDPLTLSDVFTALGERQKLVRDFRYAAEATNAGGGEKLAFRYFLKQPRMLRADAAGLDTSFVFDGQHLAIIDRGQRTVLRQDLSKTDEVTVMSSLHQVFGDYSVEGYRPPLTRPKQEENRAFLEKGEGGEPRWVLVVELEDADLKEVRYTLRAPTADFLKKEFIQKDGSVYASTTVLKEQKDERTRLSFPTAWEHKSPQRSYRVDVSELVINEGLTQEPFTIEVPEGFTMREIGSR